MTLKDCYARFQGNYDEVIGRLRSERMVQKFVLKFLDDKSFASLAEAMEAHDRENAFRAAHTIKGVCQNLSFTKLGESSHDLTEALRDHWDDSAGALYERVRSDYGETAAAIRAFKEEQGL